MSAVFAWLVGLIWSPKQRQAEEAPDEDAAMAALIDAIRTGLIRDGRVRLHEFGTFRLKWGAPRLWSNPKTGEKTICGPYLRVRFMPAKRLRELVEPFPPPAVPLCETDESLPTVNPPDAAKTAFHAWRSASLAAVAFVVTSLGIPLSERTDPDDRSDTNQTSAIARQQAFLQQSGADAPAEPQARIQTRDDFFLKPFIHKVETHDSLWGLAEKFYLEPDLWPYIYRANDHVLTDPHSVTVGISLKIPGLHGKPGELMEYDRRDIAEAYYSVYRHYKSEQEADAYHYLIGVRRFSARVLEWHKRQIDPIDWERTTAARIR